MTAVAKKQGIPHLPALDGLRGCALLGVLFFHANKALPGGYLGVDLFFVLSGYLITSLLLTEHESTGRIALSTFWIRRARRLFPALLSLMPAIAAYCWFFARPDELERIRGDALATLGYVANWRSVFSHKSYWELFAAPSPLEHTWSLAIEEQFYVVWPLVVWLLLKRGSRRSVLALTIVSGVASIVAMLVMYNAMSTSRVYLGTDTRASGILAGAALAALLPPTKSFETKTAMKIDMLGFAALLGLAFAWWKLEGHHRFLYRGGFWITELGGLVLITCAVIGPKQSIVARILAFKPLTWVGMISYGLYLWHWPVNVVLTSARMHLNGAPLTAIRFAVTFAIAIVSYLLLERPIRTRGLPFGRPIYIVPAAVAVSVLLVVRATYARPRPPPSMAMLPPPPDPAPSEFTEPVTPFKVLVFGDSTANSLGWTLRGVQKRGVTVSLMGRDGCTMLYDQCYGAKWVEYTKTEQPNASLFFVGGAFMHGMEASKTGEFIQACHPDWHAKFEKVLIQRLGDLIAPNVRVFAGTIPLGLESWGGDEIDKQVGCINVSIRKMPAAVPGVRLLDLAERVCPQNKCVIRENGVDVNIRPDGVHYDMVGANILSRWILEQLAAKD